MWPVEVYHEVYLDVMRHPTLCGASCVVAAISQKPALAATAD
jgi:hypothetical protein